MTPVVSARALSHRYPGAPPILSDLELEVAQGELVLLLGPSGSGKSTLLAILAGLFAPDAGTVRIAGELLDARRRAEATDVRRRRVSLVLQSAPLFPFLSAEANIVELLRMRGIAPREATRRAREELARLGVGARASARPGTLSVGERQRVAIARALACEADLLLLDEPTAALDRESAAIAMRALRAAVSGRVGAVLVTHDARLAAHADRCLRVVDGVLAEEAPHAA